MAKARRKKTRTVTLKTARPVRKGGRTDPPEVLSAKDWTVGAIAWNKEGNIVILDPRVAQFVRQRTRDDRELEIGIPRRPTKIEKVAGGERDYDPYPDSSAGTPVISLRPPQPLQLCACDYIRLHLAEEGAAWHQPLFSDGVDSATNIR